MEEDVLMGHDKGRVVAGLINGDDLCKIREAVCVQVEKVYDHCREKDCIEDAPVMFKDHRIQWLIDKAFNVKARDAEVVDVFADVEEVPFKKGFYTVDVKFFIKVTLDFFVQENFGPGGTKIYTAKGLVVFDKKVILFGSEGGVKIFKSAYVENGIDKPIKSKLQQNNLPISKIEVADPIALNAKIIEKGCKVKTRADLSIEDIPEHISGCLEDTTIDIDERGEAEETSEKHHHHHKKEVVATIGIFSIIKLVRFVQLLIPAFDFCFPNKECIASTDEDPCELFDSIDFPVDEFFPPQIFDFPGAVESEHCMREEQG